MTKDVAPWKALLTGEVYVHTCIPETWKGGVKPTCAARPIKDSRWIPSSVVACRAMVWQVRADSF